MIGHIYIHGQIGNSVNEKGEVTEKGVELQDVIMQVEQNKGAEALYFHINSQGGNVRVGKLIANYIAKLPSAHTIAEDFCASMGTEIHLSVPLERRQIIAGTKYFIHNPLLQGVSGNADELLRASESIRPIEKEMVSMYCKATGADKAAIEGLMKQETSLTDEQCKTLGFVSSILPRLELKAVAFIDINTKKENKNFDMDKFLENVMAKVEAKFKTFKEDNGLAKKPEVNAMVVGTDKGELNYDSEAELPTVGEPVMIDGELAAEGDYTTESGWIISVDAEGNVTAVTEPAEVEATTEELKAEIKALKDGQEKRDAEMLAAFEDKLTSELEAVKSTMGSSYTPKAEKKDFKQRGQEKVSIGTLAREKREALALAKKEKQN